MLLLDYLEHASEFLMEQMEKLQKMEKQHQKSYDSDVKREMKEIRSVIRKKEAEIKKELLVNLDEFRCLKQYFPEVFEECLEDPYIGPVISKKTWLIDLKNLKPAEASLKFSEIKEKRLQLKSAKNMLGKWAGTIDSKSLVATFPVLKPYLKGKMERQEVMQKIAEADRDLKRKAWAFLVSESLIEMPLSKFIKKLLDLQFIEKGAKEELKDSEGRGTVAETKARIRLKDATRAREHYENMISQLLLANPDYLKKKKTSRNWLSKKPKDMLDKIAEKTVAHKVKEKSWIEEMNRKLAVDES